jgi:hypothetical protein
MKCSTGAGRTVRTIFIIGNNDSAASHCHGNSDKTARRMTPQSLRFAPLQAGPLKSNDPTI